MLTATVVVVAGTLVRVPFPEPVRWALVAAVLLAVALKEAGVVSYRLPENRRLVPESVFRLGRHLGPLQFGVEMGSGARTYLPSGLPYVAAVAVLLLAPVPAALCAGVGFGLGRTLMTTSHRRYGSGTGWDAEWLRYRRPLRLMLGAAFTVSLVAAVAAG